MNEWNKIGVYVKEFDANAISVTWNKIRLKLEKE